MKVHFILTGIILFAASSLYAQKNASEGLASMQTSQEMEHLKMADRLVAYGRQTKTALPLIQAVQIYQQLNVVDSTNQANPFSEEQLLSDATKYADGNKRLLALINETAKSTRGGVVASPARYFRTIDPTETITIPLYAEDAQYIQIIVDGQNEGISQIKGEEKQRSELRLVVYDNKDRIVASDQNGGENCAVSFISRTSNMTIAVSNVGQLSDNCIVYVYKTPMNYQLDKRN